MQLCFKNQQIQAVPISLMGFSALTSAVLTCAGYQNVVIKLCLHEERHCHTRHPLNESTCWHLIDDTLCGAGRGEKGTFKPEGLNGSCAILRPTLQSPLWACFTCKFCFAAVNRPRGVVSTVESPSNLPASCNGASVICHRA